MVLISVFDMDKFYEEIVDKVYENPNSDLARKSSVIVLCFGYWVNLQGL